MSKRFAAIVLATLPALAACSGGGSTNAIIPSGPTGAFGAVPAKAQSVASLVYATATPGSTYLFSDLFASNDYSQFTTLKGKWAPCSVSPAICSVTSSSTAVAGSLQWTDYTASATVTPTALDTALNKRSAAMLVFRMSDATHFDEFGLVREYDGAYDWELTRTVGTQRSTIGRGAYPFTVAKPYELSVNAVGSHIVASISNDGGVSYQTVATVDDSANATGQIGLAVFGGATASYSHVSVQTGNNPGASPTPTPSALPSASVSPTPLASTGAYPTMTPIPAGAPTDNAYTIAAPSQPLPETTPAPLCIGGNQYAFAVGDDFTQETQGQLNRYTTAWDINQYQYNGAKTNWVWSDMYSGIGRRNDFGSGDTYMVHIDDANPSRSFPASWVNTVNPRPGNLIVGSPPNAYLDVRAVAVPSQYVGDSRLNNAHWLTGALQSNKFTFGYTEATVQMPSNNGAWAAVWDLQVPGGGGYDGTGTSSTNYWEIDTFEKFGNILGLDTVQQTMNAGRSSVQLVRPTTAGSTTSYHTYGQLWVPPLLGKPAYIVFYVDRKPTSVYLAPTGVGDMNMNLNLQMGLPGSFVGTPDTTQAADMKIKNYFTWQATGSGCDGTAATNPVPTPGPTASPVPPPPVASNIVPHLAAMLAPVETLSLTQAFHLATMPANGDLLIAQGTSQYAVCPAGFKYTGAGDTYLCTAIVGQNGVAAAQTYTVGGNGFNVGALVDITNVTSYAINPDTSTGWHWETNPTITKSQSVPGANELALSFGYNVSPLPVYPTAATYTSNLPFNTIYQSTGGASYPDGIAMMETNVDPYSAPNHAVSFSGSYAWAGTPNSNGTNLFPSIVTVLVK